MAKHAQQPPAKRRRRQPLRRTLALSMVALALLPPLLLAIILATHSYQERRGEVMLRLRDTASGIGQTIDQYLLRHGDAISMMARTLSPEAPSRSDATNRYLREQRAVMDSFVSLIVADGSGQIQGLAVSNARRQLRPEDINTVLASSVADREYFRAAMSTGELYYSDVFRGRGFGGGLIVAISAPILSERGNPVGIVEGSLELSEISALVERFETLSGADLFVTDSAGQIVFSNSESVTLGEQASKKLRLPTDQPGRTAQVSYERVLDSGDTEQFQGVRRHLAGDWQVFLALPTATFRKMLLGQFLFLLAVSVAAGALALFFARMIWRRVTTPIETLAGRLSNYDPSDDDTQLELKDSRAMPAEVDQLVQAFYALSERLRQSMANLNAAHRREQNLRVNLERMVSEREMQVDQRTQQLQLRTKQLRDAAERADAATQAKSDFLANMSHEMRTPLTAVIGFTESVLESSDIDREHQQLLLTVLENAQHLEILINDILDLSKIEAGEMRMQSYPVDMSELISAIVASEGRRAQEKGLSFGVEIARPVPEKIMGDGLRLKQIVLNLTSNAIKFTDAGGVILVLDWDDDEHVLSVAVTDTGIGIDEKELERLFERFSQADSSITRRVGGTGLGLAISRHLARLMNGRLSADSEPGDGSTFTLAVPASAVSKQRLADSEALLARGRRQLPTNLSEVQLSGHVLLAEDSNFNRQLVVLLLHRMGAAVDCVANGKEAIEALEQRDYDLILMDMHMPVMGGLEATRQIRARGWKLPIVALTADVMVNHVEAHLQAGCNEALAKPIVRDHFRQVIQRYLAPQSAGEQAAPSAAAPSVASVEDDELDPMERKLQQKYLAALPDMASELAACREQSDLQAALEILHKIKGGAGGFGLMWLSERAAELEASLKDQGELHASDTGLREFEDTLSDTGKAANPS